MRKKASIIGAEKGEKEGQIWMEGERRQSVEKIVVIRWRWRPRIMAVS